MGQDLRISDDATLPGGSWYLGVAAGLVPIVAMLALDPQGWFPFTVAKWWAVLAVGLLVATFAIACGVRRDQASVPTLERVTVWLFAGLTVLIGVSTIGALDGVYAWTGTPIRHLGLLAWVIFASMFAVGRRLGTDEMARRKAVHGALGAALALGLYCLIELVWRAPVGFVSNSSRLGGPLGSAAYLGAAGCLLLPLAVGVAADTGEARGWRVVGAAGSLTLVVAVLGSGSRAALVRLAVAGIAVGLARRGHAQAAASDRRGRQACWIIAAGVVAIVAVVVAIRAASSSGRRGSRRGSTSGASPPGRSPTTWCSGSAQRATAWWSADSSTPTTCAASASRPASTAPTAACSTSRSPRGSSPPPCTSRCSVRRAGVPGGSLATAARSTPASPPR